MGTVTAQVKKARERSVNMTLCTWPLQIIT